VRRSHEGFAAGSYERNRDMQTLPVTPVETLVTAQRSLRDGNTGIVPPWLQHPSRNPGIVPPWLQGRPVQPTHPVSDDTPRILGGVATAFDPTPVDVF
jgi:hypothetical protein